MCLHVCPSFYKCTSHKGLYKPAMKEPFVLAARKAVIDTISKGYYEAIRGYLIYSPRTQVPKNKGLFFTWARFQNCGVKQWQTILMCSIRATV